VKAVIGDAVRRAAKQHQIVWLAWLSYSERVGEYRAMIGDMGNEWGFAAIDYFIEGMILHHHYHDVLRCRYGRGSKSRFREEANHRADN
jgi:hypothetical protein